jgi:hypothetical protein
MLQGWRYFQAAKHGAALTTHTAHTANV